MESVNRPRVALTGATGIIGTALREHLDGYEIRALSRRPVDFPHVLADITDQESLVQAFDGVDAVVHLAAAATVEAPWDDVLSNNIIGTYNVFEAARRAGVDLVVYASSNHVIGMYELDAAPRLYALDDPRVYDEDVENRPDSLYGVSKIFGEALGRFYADRHELRVICLRIGSVRRDDDPRSPDIAGSASWLDITTEQAYERLRATWLSKRDCVQLVQRCLEAKHIEWAVVYGVSNNPRLFWDLTRAREVLGFDPRDAAPF